MRRGRGQLTVIAVGFTAVLVIGTIGYLVLERWSLIDSLFMTVITLTTVGYGEVHPMGRGGKVFTILLIVLGVGMAAYSATVVGQFILDGTLGRFLRRRRMEMRIAGLANHCIVCGCGRTGREVIAFLRTRKIPFLAIDRDPEVAAALEDEGISTIFGNAADNEVLERAGLARARAVITCARSDADNVFIALTARAMRADVPIACRAEQRDSEPKLRRAGATYVVNSYAIAGRHLAASVFRPNVLQFLDGGSLTGQGMDFEEILVDPDSRAVGHTIGEMEIAREYQVSILAVRRQGGEVLTQTRADTRIESHDTVLALGPVAQLERLRVFFEATR